MDNKEKATQIVCHLISEIMDVNEFPETADLKDDIGMDSLDHVEFIIELERDLNISIPDSAAEAIITVNDAINYIETRLNEQK